MIAGMQIDPANLGEKPYSKIFSPSDIEKMMKSAVQMGWMLAHENAVGWEAFELVMARMFKKTMDEHRQGLADFNIVPPAPEGSPQADP